MVNCLTVIIALNFGWNGHDVADTYVKIHYLKPHYSSAYVAKVALWITKAANKTGMDPNILIAISYIESSFRYWIRRKGGLDTGLMQIMTFWTRDKLCKDFNLWDGEQNALCGARILKYYRRIWNRDIMLGLTSYNRGVHETWKDYRRGKNPVTDYARIVWSVKKRVDRFEKEWNKLRRK